MAAPTKAQSEFKELRVKFNEKSTSCHCIYYKKHHVRESSSRKPPNKTLFIINVPAYYDEEFFKRVFSNCGEISAVYFHEKPTASDSALEESQFFHNSVIMGFKVAYVVFRTNGGPEKAMQMDQSKSHILSTAEATVVVGIKKWCKQYADAIPDPNKLQAEIESYMSKYDEKIKTEKELEKQNADKPDDDGWVTVSARGKKRGFARTEHNIEKITKREKKKKAQRELINFYTFQIRETKMEHITQLRKKFEEDKKKIAMLKAARKFKPY